MFANFSHCCDKTSGNQEPKGGVYFGSRSKGVQSVKEESSQWWEQGAVAVKKQRDMPACSQFVFSYNSGIPAHGMLPP